MHKSRAALIHLWPSLLVLAIIAGLILFAWYPYPFLQFEESGIFALLLIVTAGFIGPAMTFLFYRKGKRGMTFDLVIIVLIQLAAMGWGVRAIHQSQPYFMVFIVDRFDVLSIRDVDLSYITNPKFLHKPLAGPILLYATMPTDQQIFQKILQEVMFEGKPDLQFRPEFWSLYADKLALVLQVSRPLVDLRNARPESVDSIDKLVRTNGGDIAQLNFVPAMVRHEQFATILDARSGAVIDTLKIDPWIN